MESKKGYKLTEIGMIPVDWELRPLLTTVRIANGQVDPRKEPFKSMILVAPDHIESGTGKLRRKQTAAEQHAISGKYVFASGDIVYSKIRPYLRKAVLTDFGGLCSADMYPLKPVGDVVGGFALAVLLAHRFTKFAESVSIRSGMPKINRAEMAEFIVALPPRPEQRAIAKALSDVDALLDSLDHLIAKKRDLKRAAMQQLLSGDTRLPGFNGEWKSWPIFRIAPQIIDYRGRTPLKLGMQWGEGDIPALSAKNVKMGYIDFKEETYYGSKDLYKRWMTSGHATKGDVVMTTEAPLGNVALIPDNGKYILSQRAILLKTDPAVAVNTFLLHVLMGNRFQKLLNDNSSGSTAKGIQRKRFEKLEIVLPEVPEQIAIAEVLSDMDGEIRALERRRQKTRDLKQAMMHELLTGKTRLV